ncbi:MAG: restriction endonuclease [Ignavibacteria bacterium]|nr:restriction endonuclease [Ignavibacteria bacterium]
MPQNQILITKASGEKAPFSAEKLRISLHRSGATDEQAERVIDELTKKLYSGITTKKIYHIAFRLLKETSRHIAAKYHLKRAIMELGPSGYPFEKFIGEILRLQGFSVQVGQIVQGHCVEHEVDVVAMKDNLQLMIECKYHNQPGVVCDVKVPLYIQSRFKDVEAEWMKSDRSGKKIFEGWVVTNTRFSSSAVQYGTCVGLKLLGWDYPGKWSLKDQIETLGLYPITCLTALTKAEKEQLLNKKIVLCREIVENEKLLRQMLSLTPLRLDTVMKEARELSEKVVAR